MADGLSRHHRKPRILGGTNDQENISIVPQKMHDHFHCLFQTKTPPEIARILNETWIDPDFVFICVNKKDGITLGEINALIKS